MEPSGGRSQAHVVLKIQLATQHSASCQVCLSGGCLQDRSNEWCAHHIHPVSLSCFQKDSCCAHLVATARLMLFSTMME